MTAGPPVSGPEPLFSETSSRLVENAGGSDYLVGEFRHDGRNLHRGLFPIFAAMAARRWRDACFAAKMALSPLPT